MREVHPNVQNALQATRKLKYRIAEVRERADAIFARRPSPSGLIIPEVDAMGRLRDLYIAPGTCTRLGNRELADDMMAAISESRKDARRQYYIVMNDRDSLPPPLADEMRRQRSNRTTDGDLLSSEKAE